MTLFEDLGINQELLNTIEKLKFEKPTDIQEQSIPLIMDNKDVIGESATGSGKTLAFGAGIIKKVEPKKGLQSLILTPTRELALQVSDALKEFSERKLKIVTVYGGVGIDKQIFDLRKAEVGHWREVRDLIGGDYYVYTGNDFDNVYDYHAADTANGIPTPTFLTVNEAETNQNQMKTIGDKIAYHNTNTIDWRGFYWQGEYTKDKLNLLAVMGFSSVGYTYVDHFTTQSVDTLGENGTEFFAYNRDIAGGQYKLGASYRIFDNSNIYANYADVYKVPNFDGAINDGDGSVYVDPMLEHFMSREYGFINRFDGGFLRVNYYNTDWLNRSNSIGVQNADGSDGYVYLSGINAKHKGVEGEIEVQINDLVSFNGSIAINDWYYTSDVDGFYNDYGSGGLIDYTYYLNNLKVGDQPQYQQVLTLGLTPIRNLKIDVTSSFYAQHYANWSPFSRTDSTDIQQSWKIPDYHLLDLHFAYNITNSLQLSGHFFNLFDKVYVHEAVDNSSYNAYSADGKTHSANDAEVFLGLPRRFNMSLSYSL